MGTQCYIAKQIGDDKYRTIYCHFDGYPEHCGAILLDAYNTPEKLDELLSLGDISYLGPQLSPESGKSYDPKDVTVAYARDLGEKKVEAKDMTLDQLQDCDFEIQFVYIFDSDGVWKFFDVDHSYGAPKSVKEALEEEFPDAVANAADGYHKAIVNYICQQDQSSPNLSM